MTVLLAIETWHPKKTEYMTCLTGSQKDLLSYRRLGSRPQATGHVDICGGGHQVSIRETSGLAVFPNHGAGVAGEAGGLGSGDTYPWASVTVRNLALTLSVLGTSG